MMGLKRTSKCDPNVPCGNCMHGIYDIALVCPETMSMAIRRIAQILDDHTDIDETTLKVGCSEVAPVLMKRKNGETIEIETSKFRAGIHAQTPEIYAQGGDGYTHRGGLDIRTGVIPRLATGTSLRLKSM
jgi:hypothetical protein